MQNRRFSTQNVHKVLAVFLGVFLVSVTLLYHLTHFLHDNDPIIHIVYMLGGNSYSRHLFHTHLKSLLAFSNSSLHLHVIADSENIEDVQVLLETWTIPRCNYTFYNEKDYTDKIPQVPDGHYSKQFGYLKLELPDIIQGTEKVLTLDVDLVMQVDVKELWDMFGGFNSTNFLGMVHTTSAWYTLGRNVTWPAVGTGFNSGVQLMDFVKMRTIGFAKGWRASFKKNYDRIGANPIADQDIFNAWIFENPETFMEIPCQYNYEVGGASRQERCPVKRPLLIHFNTQDKEPNPGLEKFGEIRKVYQEMDGDVLARSRSYFDPDNTKNALRILPNAYGRRNASKLCWGTHLGSRNLEIFLEHADLWNLPIAVVLYGSDKEVNSLSTTLSSLNRTDITVHSIFGNNITPDPKFFRDLIIDHTTNCEEFLISHVAFDFVGDLGNLLNSPLIGNKGNGTSD